MVRRIIQLNESKKGLEKVENVEDINNANIRKCLCDLNDTLLFYRNKFGDCILSLSAPQIGYLYSIILICSKKEKLFLINSNIRHKSNDIRLFSIDCLDLGLLRGVADYSNTIKVMYTDIEGRKEERIFEGSIAANIQYHVDSFYGYFIYEKLVNGKNDLFIPRERLYNKHVPLKNYAVIVNLLQKIGMVNVQSFLSYYSMLLNDEYDFEEYVYASYKKRNELVETIMRYVSREDNILEAGCGTSALSIFLSLNHYSVFCVDISEEMLLIAKNINKKVGGQVKYYRQDIKCLEFENKSFKVIFSHGVLEHFCENDIVTIVNEGLRIAKVYIISVPTIWDISNGLLGDEKLWTVSKWKKLFLNNNFNVLETIKAFPSQKLKNMGKKILSLPSGNVIFVLTRRDVK